MSKTAVQKNKIKDVREERGLSSRALAKKLGTSAPHLSRLENGKTPLSIKWIVKIASVLGVSTHEIMDVSINKAALANCDEALLSSALGWLLEATDDHGVTLSHQELSKWAGFVYKEALDVPLNFKETRYLADTLVRVIKRDRQSRASN